MRDRGYLALLIAPHGPASVTTRRGRMRPTHRLLAPVSAWRITMLPLSALSRRALVAATTALVAVVPSAEARTRKPPLAFVKATLSDPTVPAVTTFGFTFQAAIAHPAS